VQGKEPIEEVVVNYMKNCEQTTYLPGEQFDDTHVSEQFLEQLRSPISKHHALHTNFEQRLHDPSLHRSSKDKKGKPCKCGGSQVREKQDQTNSHLDWCRPAHVEEASAKIDAGDVGRDMVDELAVSERRACAGC